MRWLLNITDNPDDYAPVLAAFEHFQAQHASARKNLDASGRPIVEVARWLPGEMEFRYGQLQEIEGIIRHLEIREQKLRGDARKHFLEHYNRALTERQVERYAEADQNVIAVMELRNMVAFVRNLYLGLTKGYEMLHFQLGTIAKLRMAGLDDAIV